VADPTIVESVLSQHAEEAAFLWLVRDNAVHAPHYSLKDLARLDNRIEAHLEGLSVAGEAGWEIVCSELKWKEPGEVFAAAAVALMSDEVSRMQPVLEVARTTPELSRGMIAALAFLPTERVALRVSQLCASQDPDRRRIGIAASACQRLDAGRPLVAALESDNPSLRARALRAVGELGRIDLLPAARAGIKDADDSTRLWAAWSCGLLGDKGTAEVLRGLVRLDFPGHAIALDMCLRLLDPPDASRWREELVKDPAAARLAIQAAGVIGDPAPVPWLIDQMADDVVARVAGESFTFITGADLALANLEKKPPETVEAGPNDNPLDENVALDPDENLPWPDPELIRAWWSKNSSRFAIGVHHLLGKPLNSESLNVVLRTGRQRQRAAAALELALSSKGRPHPLFETRAPARRQRQLLGLSGQQ
jgi:uncharacterized protein (TIGR02270 family)